MIPALECLCIVSIGIKDGVYNLKVSGNESVFFSFVWRLKYKNAQNCYGMLIKIQKSLWNLIYAQMIIFCRWLMQLHDSDDCQTSNAKRQILLATAVIRN